MSKDVVFVHPGEEICTLYRMAKGAEIYKMKNLKKFVISETLKQSALELGIPLPDILTLQKARSTIEELYFLRERIFKSYCLDGAYLISCKAHGQRVRKIAKQELKGYDWEFVPVEHKNCKVEASEREKLANFLDDFVLVLCRLIDRPDIWQTLVKSAPKSFYSRIRK